MAEVEEGACALVDDEPTSMSAQPDGFTEMVATVEVALSSPVGDGVCVLDVGSHRIPALGRMTRPGDVPRGRCR